MADPQGFLDTVIVPAAQALDIYTLPHLQQGFGTGAHESGFQDVQQEGGGPALGPFQMEPATHDSLWANFLAYRPTLRAAIVQALGVGAPVPPPADEMMANLQYAALMMFCRYLDAPGAIPADLPGQAAYYIKNYNAGGKATPEEYINDYQRFAQDVTFPLA